MANNLDSNISQIVLKKFLPGFMSDLVLCKTVDRQLLAGEINSSTGDSVSFKRPHQFASLRTVDGDLTGKKKSPIISGKATGRVGKYISVAVEYTQIEEALKLNQLDQILSPIRERIVTDLETELAQFMMANGALSLGSPGTPISKWSDVARTASLLRDLGIKTGENYAVMDPWSAQRLADAQGSLHAVDALVRTAWENAQISGNFGGIRALISNGLASRTQGSLGKVTIDAQTVSYDSVKDTYQITLKATGLTASAKGVLNPGDQLRLGVNWVNQQTKQTLYDGSTAIGFTCTVLETVDAGADGKADIKVSGAPIYTENADMVDAAYNVVDGVLAAGEITPIGKGKLSYKPNLFYNKFFCGLGTIPLPKLHSTDSAVATYEGFSIRVHKYSDGDANKQKMRFDLLPAYACFNPHMGGQFSGQP